MSRLAIAPNHYGERGVFATSDFREGDVVEVCPYTVVDAESVSGVMEDYLFDGPEPGQRLLIFGYGMLYNHSRDGNLLYHYEGDDSVVFSAARDIAAGDELTVDYGASWWRSRGRTPVE